MRACDRILSGVAPATVAERLAELGDGYDLDEIADVYGAGGPLTTLEQRVAALLGTEAAAFFPSGTMAQQVALRCWAERSGNQIVAMHPLHHPEMHERHAYSALSGLRSVWPTSAPRMPTAEEVRACAEPFGTLMLEIPLREAGFVLPGWDELTAVVDVARERGAKVHLDGARLWESTFHLGHSLSEISALADSVYVSFYKSLGGIAGAVLAGSADFVQQAVAWRHRYGGQIFQQWPTALSALAGLDRELPRLGEYVAHAKIVAAALAEVPGIKVYPAVPHTHQFRAWLPYSAEALNAAVVRLAEQEKVWVLGPWWENGLPGMAMTEVTIGARGLEFTAEDVTSGMNALLARVSEQGSGTPLDA